MSPPWDSESPDMQAVIEEIVRTAVTYGYLRGLDRASATATAAQSDGPGSARWLRRRDIRARLAREAAEEFLRKVYVEQLTSGSE